MPSIHTLLSRECPKCRKHKIFEHGLCWFCERAAETPEAKAARERETAAAFRARFPRLVEVAERHRVPGYDQWDDEKEGQWDGIDERIYD